MRPLRSLRAYWAAREERKQEALRRKQEAEAAAKAEQERQERNKRIASYLHWGFFIFCGLGLVYAYIQQPDQYKAFIEDHYLYFAIPALLYFGCLLLVETVAAILWILIEITLLLA